MTRLTKRNNVTGLSISRQTTRKLGKLIGGALLAVALASPGMGQDGQPPTTKPTVALPPSLQLFFLDRLEGLLSDASVPDARRWSAEICLQGGPLEFCESTDGRSFSVARGERFVTFDRDQNGRWQVGVGVRGSTPGNLGVDGSVAVYPATGNVQGCVGARAGIGTSAGVSLSGCLTVDRQRAADLRSAQAWADQVGQQPAANDRAAPPADHTRLVMTSDARASMAQNAYNPPADLVGSSNPPAADQQTPPPAAQTPPAGASPQMTDEQFRALMAVTMRQFQQAAAAQQQAYDNSRPTQPQSTTDRGDGSSSDAGPNDDSGPRGEARLTFDDSVPRASNGQPSQTQRSSARPAPTGAAPSARQNRVYSADGNSLPIGAGNGRYDANGSYVNRTGGAAPARQNRAYSIDGGSRPIGRTSNAAANYWAVQQQANRQLAAQQGGGYSAAVNSGGYSTSQTVSAPSYSATDATGVGGPSPSAQLVFVDSTPRQTAPSQSVVAPRASGTVQPAAGLAPFGSAVVSPRQTGSAPQTAGIVLPD